MKVLLIVFFLIPLFTIPVFTEPYITTVKDTGVDVFTDKTFYEIGGDVSLGIRIDPEKISETNPVSVTIWDIHYDSRTLAFDVAPQDIYYYKFTLDESFSGEVKVVSETIGDNGRKWWDEYYFYVGVNNITDDDLVHARMGLGNVIQETNPADYVYLNSKGKIGPEYTPEEIQAREEIPNPCVNIREPKVAPEYQGDIGLNDPVYMETFREAQYQHNQQMQHCFNEYQKLIEQRVAELQCGDFEFGEYTPIEDYDLVYDLFLNGLHERNDNTGRFLIDNYRGTFQYDNECQSFYKEFQLLTKETERWNESCPDSGSSPNGQKHRYMLDIFNVCRFATLVATSAEEPTQGSDIVCGAGTILKDGFCVPERETMTTEMQQKSSGGGCLIATATFGSELSSQVQQLREIRDNSLLQTESGRTFMESFNQFYYSFSPTIADLERENPIFKEAVKLTITPLLYSLSLLNYVDMDSEVEVIGYGISLILLNVGMYFVLPAIVIHRVRKFV